MKYPVTLVHDYFVQAGGGERVAAALHQLFPEAPVFTSVINRATLWPELQDAAFYETWMRALPAIHRSYRLYFLLYPFAMRGLRLPPTRVVISSSSAYAMHVVAPRDATHICYCHTPMRFAWQVDQYLGQESLPSAQKQVVRAAAPLLRSLDRAAASHVDQFVANSRAVRDRILRFYGRDAVVVPPPVHVDRFRVLGQVDTEPYLLVVSRLVAYKRIDVVVRAAREGKFPLVVLGDGPARPDLERLAEGSSQIRFLGKVSDDEVVRYLQHCYALVFPGEEDFGIAPVEAHAAGRPVLAYAAGGALDTIQDGLNGVLFNLQTSDAVIDAWERSQRVAWDSAKITRTAERFRPERFYEGIQAVVNTYGG